MTRGRTIGLVVAVAGVIAITALPQVHDVLLSGLARAEAIIRAHRVLGPLVFIMLAGLSAMLAFFSSAILVPVGIRAWGIPTCVVLLWIGWMLGGAVSYAFARWVGRPLVRRAVSKRKFAEYQSFITQRTPFGVVLLFQLALPSEIPGYVLGVAAYPMLKYLTALGLVELPYAVGVAVMGASFLERRIWLLAVMGAAAVLVALFAARALYRQRAVAAGQ